MELPDFLAFCNDSDHQGGTPSDRSKGETGNCCKARECIAHFLTRLLRLLILFSALSVC